MTILEVQNLTKVYPRNNLRALSEINLKVEDNSFLALLGKNGAGKSTFVGIVSSLIRKTSGKVLVDGKDLDKDLLAIKKIIGLVPQEINLAIFETPMQILVNQAGYFGIESRIAQNRATKYLKLLGLWDKRNDQVLSLSGGMKRRVMIARSLMHDPKILFLDEPTAGVDVEIRYKIWDALKELQSAGKTIILTTHYLEEAEKLCDTIAIIDHGLIKYHGRMSHVLIDKSYYTVVVKSKHNKKITEGSIKSISDDYEIIDKTTAEINVDHALKTIGQALEEIVKAGFFVEQVKQKQTSIERLFNTITAAVEKGDEL